MDQGAVLEIRESARLSEEPKVEHHIYFEWVLNDRAGGPPGYLANLLHGYGQVQNYDRPLIVFDNYRGKNVGSGTEKKPWFTSFVKQCFSIIPGGKEFYINYLSRTQRSAFSSMYTFLSNIDKAQPDSQLISKIDWSKTRSVHVHTALDVLKVKNYLRDNFLDDVKVILTCHTPESMAKEQYALALSNGQSEKRARELEKLFLSAEILAYKKADIIIFPSEEAMEPLLHDIPEFKEIAKNKDIRFMATGSKKLFPTLTREKARKKYGVEGKRVIGYIGRHNSVKGYDLLKKAAEKVLAEKKDVVFLIGGSQGTEFGPLNDPAWIEAGWVNPADMLKAVDVFALPNRQTYYDLVLLEVLSMGIPTVATATGGNKSVKKIATGLELCDVSAESLADAILTLLNLTDDELKKRGNDLYAVYNRYFTEKQMAERYVDTIQKIYCDYNLWGVEREAKR